VALKGKSITGNNLILEGKPVKPGLEALRTDNESFGGRLSLFHKESNSILD
jgi:hypothetical protein